jgi:hypothetical protein
MLVWTEFVVEVVAPATVLCTDGFQATLPVHSFEYVALEIIVGVLGLCNMLVYLKFIVHIIFGK